MGLDMKEFLNAYAPAITLSLGAVNVLAFAIDYNGWSLFTGVVLVAMSTWQIKNG